MDKVSSAKLTNCQAASLPGWGAGGGRDLRIIHGEEERGSQKRRAVTEGEGGRGGGVGGRVLSILHVQEPKSDPKSKVRAISTWS